MTLGKKNLILAPNWELSEAILRISQAFQNSLNLETILTGYFNCGIHPLNYENLTSKCMALSQLSPDDNKQLLDSLPKLIDIFRKNGRITEGDMDECHIPHFDGFDGQATPNDERAISKQRGLILNLEAYLKLNQQKQSAFNRTSETKAKGSKQVVQIKRQSKVRKLQTPAAAAAAAKEEEEEEEEVKIIEKQQV
jgi:hypothetical protein